ncbi:MAG TPA: hypothetical protein VNS57_13970 [Steroidobacteraceae bacterium]|nr:hypothetical protein [Steroidobacteraceae bacterium]
MKLPLGSTIVGLLFGIAGVLLVSPQTTEGAAFLMLTIVLVVTAIGLLAGKLRNVVADRATRSRRLPGRPRGRRQVH